MKLFGLPLLLLLHLSVFLIFNLPQASAEDTSFIFNGFYGNNMSLSGVAGIDDGLIKLTNLSSRLFGRAFYPISIHMKKNSSTKLVSSFSTTFVFCISPLYETIGGHGMAFVMAPSLDTRGAFPSQYLGILNATNDNSTSNHVFAVELDTVQDLEFADINDNHVGINLNSMISTYAAAAGYWTIPANASQNSFKTEINLKSEEIIQAWVDFDGYNRVLNVSIAPLGSQRPLVPLLSVDLDLSEVLEEYMYVGFTAATGVISGIHRVLAWSFNSNGDAQSLDLSLLPSVFPHASIVTSRGFKTGISLMCVFLVLSLGALVGFIVYKRSKREVVEDWELEFGLDRYSYKELQKATDRFCDRELLGVGGFGRVYRGVLPKSGLEVAVKRLSRESDQGEREFIAEMASTGRLRHRNLVQLLGWSRRKGELLLVYEYMPNRSLDKVLYGKSGKILRWEQRQKIMKGVASGMLYLHEGWEQQVLHRDIKASNVLLDADMNGKLGDFGLARLYEHGQNPHTTRVVGTLGYLAPEFARTGKATTSTDVYSFGVLLLEVATGRHPIEHRVSVEDFLLVEGVLDLYLKGRLLEVVDPRLDGLFDAEEVKKVLVLGLLCAHPEPSIRPSMRQVVQILVYGAPLPLQDLAARKGSSQNTGFSFASSSTNRSLASLDASMQLSAR